MYKCSSSTNLSIIIWTQQTILMSFSYTMDKTALILLLCLGIMMCLLSNAECYMHFQDAIPNGAHVPHPCQPNKLWKGVGHKNRDGGGPRNPFGQDFETNGKVWTETLCRMDSDGDGRTNGEELGDPNCTWVPGTAAENILGLSHPGICDPVENVSVCGDKPDYVSCEEDSLQCEALNDPDNVKFNLTLPVSPVPAQETTYMCILLELPQTGDYHLVATEAIIDNVEVMHHLLVYGCRGDGVKGALNEPTTCTDMSENCFDIIAGWTVGTSGECPHKDSGFRVGENGYRYVRLELHWNNPREKPGMTDGSGITLHLSRTLRMFDAGTLMIGENELVIPPGQSHHEERGWCPAECTRKYMTDSIFITGALNHMHYLGVQQITELYRGGKKIRDIAADTVYSYDNPVQYSFDEPIEVYPGDELRTKCVFKSTARDGITYYGDDTSAEMCFSFLTYYPAENLKNNFCVSLDMVSPCGWDDGEIEGCEFWKYMNSSHPEAVQMREQVMKVCSPHGECLSSCLPLVRQLKKEPCFNGFVNKFLRGNTRYFRYQNAEERAKVNLFYAAFDSCDYTLGLEDAKTGVTGISGSVPLQSIFFLQPILAVFIVLFNM